MKTHIELALALAFVPSVSFAAESANFSLTPAATDAGGRRSTSANYTLDSSTAPGGTGKSANYTARTGYAGSPYDVLALEINASPLTVNEGAARQLGASLLLDDSSLLTLARSEVTWSVQSGPLLSISAGGLATAETVYQDANAVAQGGYQSFIDTLALSVLNVNIDDFGLYAGDGIRDDWQVLYFGTGNANAGPLLDPDNDGWTNLFEYQAGIVPTDP